MGTRVAGKGATQSLPPLQDFLSGTDGIDLLVQRRFEESSIQKDQCIHGLILSAICLIVGFQICLIGLVAELISINREKLEDILYRIKKIELENVRDPKE